MVHHKRRRPKHQRSGCLSCEPYKDEREAAKDADPIRVRRVLQIDRNDIHGDG